MEFKVICVGLLLLIFVICLNLYTHYISQLKLNNNRVSHDQHIYIKNGGGDKKDRQNLSEYLVTSNVNVENNIHCEAIPLGCFELRLKPTKAQQKDIVNIQFQWMTKTWCVSYCSSLSLSFAGLMNQKVCSCSNKIFSLTTLEYSNKCDAKCLGNENENCGGNPSFNMFRLPNSCKTVTDMKKDFLESKVISCFDNVNDILPYINDGKAEEFIILNPSACFAICGFNKEPIAITNNKNSCWCGKLTKRYNFNNQRAICRPDSVIAYKTFAIDSRCDVIRFLPPSNNNKTALSSPPGSGNTWSRHLIEKGSGYFTGSVYCDPFLQNQGGFIGERKESRSRTTVIKDHMLSGDNTKSYQSIILLIRNPYDSLIAEFNRLSTKSHTGHVAIEKFREPGFKKYVQRGLSFWGNLIKYVSKWNQRYLLVSYEDLKRDPIKETERMIKFINFPNLTESQINEKLLCLNQNIDGRVKRKTSKEKIDPYNDELRKMINQQLDESEKLMKQKNVSISLSKYKRNG